MKTHHGLLCLFAALALACGGSPKKAETTPVGESSGPGSGSVSDDLDVDDNGASNGGGQDQGAGTDKPGDAADPIGGDAAVTFRLNNTYKEDLVLSLDKGWTPVIFAYSGKPPNAKSILMFPSHCTAACSAGDGERCPICKAPEKVKEIKAAEKREVIASGKSLDVPWDGRVYVYQETDDDGRSCKCFKRADVPPETYTIKACGFRITKSASKSTKIQCVQSEAKFPGDGAQVIELEFGKP